MCQDSEGAGNNRSTNRRDPVETSTAHQRFTAIYETHYEQVLAYSARRVDFHDSDDVANQVFEVLWKHIEEVETGQVLPWLYRVAHNLVAHRWRGRGRWQRLVDRISGTEPDRSPSTEELVVQREQDRTVLAALGHLSPSDQEVLRLAAWEEMTAKECAQVLGCSVSAAEQRLHRAKKRLARRLSGDARLAQLSSPRSAGGPS